MKDALVGKQRRIEKLERVMRTILRTCDDSYSTLYCAPTSWEAVKMIAKKARAVLDND